nr:hypothetical protein [Phytohabitans aurantiacus]
MAGLQDGDSPEHWAALAHDLRDTALHAREHHDPALAVTPRRAD